MLLLGIVCTAIHGWLCRIRPETRNLPRYYFFNACGGAIGGLAAGCMAPIVFTGVNEYPLALLACAAVFAVVVLKFVTAWPGEWRRNVSPSRILRRGDRDGKKDSAVPKFGKSDLHLMRNGQTTHGAQFMAPSLKNRPTMYYTALGGGIAFSSFGLRDSPRPLHVGVIGLGADVMATWGLPGDVMRFYEISPECIDLATNATFFTYCADSKAAVEFELSDARLALQAEQENLQGTNAFDILVVDAYTGDSVPLHLITAEAFELYANVLKADGVLALHLSNWHVDLWPVVKAAARHLGWTAHGTYSKGGGDPLAAEAAWAFLTRTPRPMKLPFGVREVDWRQVENQPLLRDDKGSLFFNLSFSATPPLCDY